MKIYILILTTATAITLGLSGCMMKKMFSENSDSKMKMMSKVDNLNISNKEIL